MHVVGTAGHVDHGKSTLVHALSGIDPDRLREEQEREMTIDLGFAWLTLPGGGSVGLVDVPGHRDFIGNMLAGVGGIDAALLVVAADEGVKPQTLEHLAILDLLAVEKAVVALTKVDLSESDEWTKLVSEDVSNALVGTTLEGAPIVPVSARTGYGLDDLLAELEGVLAQVQERPDRGHPRLPVDRVFSISGFGTVVTGTLTDGTFTKGQEVEILPRGTTARIRGIQTHKEALETAQPGSRVALNLSGATKMDVERGDVVTSPGWLKPTLLADVQIRHLEDVPRPLRHNSQVKLFAGAAEQMARVRLLDSDALAPGETGWAQLKLEKPQPLVQGDRFIIRIPSPGATVGGGVVVDPHPGRTHRRSRSEVIERLETLARGTPSELLIQELDRLGPVTYSVLLSSTSQIEEVEDLVGQLLKSGELIALDGADEHSGRENFDRLLSTREWWTVITERLKGKLSSYHDERPLKLGMSREALRSGLGLEAKVFTGLVARAASEGLIAEENALIRLSSHEVRLNNEQEKAVSGLLAAFAARPFLTPSVKESSAAVGQEVLEMLVARGDLVQVSTDVLFLADTYKEMVGQVRREINKAGSTTLAQVRDLLGTSRKYAQALLEHLDSQGITKREGDVRVLRSS